MKPELNNIKQQGFTLIELVIVIVMIGILTAFAIPQFMEYRTEARIAQLKSIAGSVRAAAQMSRAVWLAQDNPASTSINVDNNGVPLAVTVSFTKGYPVMATGGIDNAVKILGATNVIYSPANGRFSLTGLGVASTACYIQYDETLGDVPTDATGIVVTGC